MVMTLGVGYHGPLEGGHDLLRPSLQCEVPRAW